MAKKSVRENDVRFGGASSEECGHCGGNGTCTRRCATCGSHTDFTMGGATRIVPDGKTCGYCDGHGSVPA